MVVCETEIWNKHPQSTLPQNANSLAVQWAEDYIDPFSQYSDAEIWQKVF